jgi:iron transport multicopper oxidase
VTKTATITANQSLTVTSLNVGNPAFSLGMPTPPLPAVLTQGQTISVPVSFTPATSTLYAAAIDVASSAGPGSVSLVGRGQATGPLLVASAKTLSFGGLARGRTSTINIVLSNAGAQPVVWGAFTPPAAPFSVTNLPTQGAQLAPDGQVTLSVTFAPTMVGQYSGQFTQASNGGDLTIMLSGSAGEPPSLVIGPPGLDFGAQPRGSTTEMSFTVGNSGGANLTITKSKPPGLGVFKSLTPLDEGVVIPPGQMFTLTIAFSPTTLGSFADQWTITGDDASGVHMVAFTGSSAEGDGGVPPTDAPVVDGGGGETARPPDGGGGSDAKKPDADVSDAAPDAGASVQVKDDGGCGCRVGGRPAPLPLPAVLLLGLIALVAGRARQR